ncbi:hypothetical protein [Coleofasciculus sp. G2-EDA-02]|uniref:hypothetical protein n=1 Tax=Coleofasciculus sp. G2-EDA-02 TaxID=3069529 RepID=UPI0032F8EFA8
MFLCRDVPWHVCSVGAGLTIIIDHLIPDGTKPAPIKAQIERIDDKVVSKPAPLK